MEKYEAAAAFDLMRAALNERQWRMYLAVEAKRIGRGGISMIAREAHTTRKTIRTWIAEIEGGQVYVEGIVSGAVAGAGNVCVHRIRRWLPLWKDSLSRRVIS